MRLQQHQLLLQRIHMGFINRAIELILIGIAARQHRVFLDMFGQFGIFDIERSAGVGHYCLSVVISTVL